MGVGKDIRKRDGPIMKGRREMGWIQGKGDRKCYGVWEGRIEGGSKGVGQSIRQQA